MSVSNFKYTKINLINTEVNSGVGGQRTEVRLQKTEYGAVGTGI